MKNLSRALDVCAPLLEGDILFLDYPDYGNVGDHLIWQGTKAFLKRNNKNVIGSFSPHNVGWRALSLLENCTTICFQGGGNLGDLWFVQQKFREDIIQRFPQKRIVIMPQSVHFDSLENLDRACAVFKKHPDLHIFLRDKNSFGLLQQKQVPNIALCPDMAHALWGHFAPPMADIQTPLYLFRRDKEKRQLPPGVVPLGAPTFDWDNLLTGFTKKIFEFGIRLPGRDIKYGMNYLPVETFWNAIARHLIRRSVNLFARHDTIVTDRLHAVILGALLERKVVAYDNSYGKLSSYIDCWLCDLPAIMQKRL